MVNLVKILNIILEQENFNDLEFDNVVEFPNQNFTVTFFPKEKKIFFIPQHHESLPYGIKKILFSIRQKFKISNIKSLNDKNKNFLKQTYEVFVDPTENFDLVSNFIKQLAGGELK